MCNEADEAKKSSSREGDHIVRNCCADDHLSPATDDDYSISVNDDDHLHPHHAAADDSLSDNNSQHIVLVLLQQWSLISYVPEQIVKMMMTRCCHQGMGEIERVL